MAHVRSGMFDAGRMLKRALRLFWRKRSEDNRVLRASSRYTLAGIVAAMLSASAGTAIGKEWTRLRLGTDPTSPPQASLRPDGTMEGFDIDLAADVCARMRLECEWVRQDFDDMIPALNAGKFDVIFVGLLITERRKQLVDFCVPFTIVRQGILARREGPLAQIAASDKIVSLSEPAAAQPLIANLAPALRGKVVGVDSGTPRAEMVRQHFPDAELRTYPNLPAVLADLMAGRIDAEVAPGGFITNSLNGPDGAKLTRIGPWFNGGPFGVGVSVAVRKTDPELKDRLDAAIQAALADGTVRSLALKWYKMDVTPPT